MTHAFPCGTLPLDFVGTLRARRNPLPQEMLGEPGALADWFVEAGMMDERPSVDDASLARALRLRESIYSLVDAAIRQEPLPAEAIAQVNELSAVPPIRLELRDGAVRRSGTVEEGLASLAREAVAILGGPDAELLRECGRPECTQVYLDRSRGHRREWCSMKTCGNRVKASAFRERQRAAVA
jgi:predicted RNA-binding Zn ribbon-like protein